MRAPRRRRRRWIGPKCNSRPWVLVNSRSSRASRRRSRVMPSSSRSLYSSNRVIRSRVILSSSRAILSSRSSEAAAFGGQPGFPQQQPGFGPQQPGFPQQQPGFQQQQRASHNSSPAAPADEYAATAAVPGRLPGAGRVLSRRSSSSSVLKIVGNHPPCLASRGRPLDVHTVGRADSMRRENH